jgi:hypothetical protein
MPNPHFTWTSSNVSAVLVAVDTGAVTGVVSGTASVTVTDERLTENQVSATVHVVEPDSINLAATPTGIPLQKLCELSSSSRTGVAQILKTCPRVSMCVYTSVRVCTCVHICVNADVYMCEYPYMCMIVCTGKLVSVSVSAQVNHC